MLDYGNTRYHYALPGAGGRGRFRANFTTWFELPSGSCHLSHVLLGQKGVRSWLSGFASSGMTWDWTVQG